MNESTTRLPHPAWRAPAPPALVDALSAGMERGTEGFFLLDAEARLRFVNGAAERALGRDRGALVGRCIWAELPELEGAGLGPLLHAARSGEGAASADLRLGAPPRWYRVRAFADAAGTGVFLLDTTAERDARQALGESEERLRRAVSGRAAFVRELSASADPYAVVCLEVDRFALVGEGVSPDAGERMLAEAAARLHHSVGDEHLLARLDDVSFAVLPRGVRDRPGVMRLCERMQGALAHPFAVEGHAVFTSAAVGVALADGGDAEALLRGAELAMHRSRAAGGTRVNWYDRSLHARTRARLRLESDLRGALERDELHLHFQPVVELASGRAVGAEALVRWNHPERGPVEPAEFIPMAEESGLIDALGEWVVREACAALPALREAGGEEFILSINLSAAQFARGGLAERLAHTLRETGTPPHAVAVEITESALLGRLDEAAHVLRELRAGGVRVYIDDFGTGYSSLAYLHRLPLDAIKVDRSFVEGVGGEPWSRQVVSSVVTLAESLGVRVIAEGVSDPAQRDILRAIGCGYAQGFLFSRPVPAHELCDLLRR
jgi:EAL domain-containing protein (putative c-di-GMP-specific phosphodiesterase class I)/GGDEF domain-containing protein